MAKGLNAAEVLENINKAIEELEGQGRIGAPRNYDRFGHRGYDYTKGFTFKMRAIYNELSIFDWWNDELSMSQLKQMKSFVETAIKLGFNGYVCFKVGARGCSHGMWASTDESLDGYSPKTGNTLHHSFVSGENYYDVEIDGHWMSKGKDTYKFTLAQVKAALNK